MTDTRKGTAPTFTPVGLTATTKFYCVVGSGSVCTQTVTSPSITVTVQKSPKISTQPVSQSVCGSTGVTLSVTAANADTYQWYYNGATTGGNSATLANVKDGGVYTCVVSKAGGLCGEVTSVPALITVAAAPKVSLGSRTGLSACEGDLITLPSPEIETGGSVIVPGKTGWYLSSAADPAAAPLVASFVAGATDVTYHYKLTYKCSEGAGTETVLTTAQGMPSLAVKMTTPVKVTRQPVSYTACAYSALSVAASGSGLTYQWYNGSGTAVGAANATTYTPTADGSYYCVVTGSCGSVTSATALATKTPAVTITSQPKALIICDGGVATLQVESSNAASYQWQSGATSGGAYTNLAGETAASLTVSPSATTYYKCVVTGICGSVTSAAVGVTVNTPVMVTRQPVSETKCSDESFSALTVAASGTSPLTCQWYRNGTAVGASSSSYSPGTSAGTYHCVVSNGCGSVMSATAVLSQATAPVVNLSTATVTYCKGSEVTLPTPAIEGNGSVLNPALSGWSGTSTGTALTSTVKAPSTAGGSQAYYYRIQYTCGTKAAAYATSARTMTVTAQAMPVAPTFTTATGAEVCEGTSVTLPAVTNRSGQWELNGTPKGEVTVYLVHAADSGQVFRYVNTDACGQRTQSTSTYTLKVKREARISSLLPGTTTLKVGTKVTLTAPGTTGSPTTKKWILRTGTSQKLTDGEVLSATGVLTASRNLTLADDHKLLTFAAEGCLVSPDETSTTLKVWSEPTFTGDDGASDLIVSQVGQPYPFLAPPTINWNNTTPISEGWAVVGESTYRTAVAAVADDGKTICYRVGYQEPGSSVTKYVTSRTMGILRPWDVPVLSGSWSENPICAVVGGTWTLPTAPTVAANNTTVTVQEWVYKSGTYIALNTSTVNYAEQDGKALCRKITYRIPGSTADRVVYSPVMGILRPYDQPVFPADQTTEKLTQVGQYYSITTPTFNNNGLTVYTEWIIGGFLSGTIAEWRHDAQPIVYKVQYKNACAAALTVQNIQVGTAKVYATSRTASTTGPNRVPDDGKNYWMMDPRDNQFYAMRVDLKTKYLVMMTGLNYGNCHEYNSGDFKSNSVNGKDYKMRFTGVDLENGTTPTYWGGCMNSKENTHKLYNFAALIQSDVYVDTDPWESYDVQGICPPGWKLNSWSPDAGNYAITESPMDPMSSLPRGVQGAPGVWREANYGESIAKTRKFSLAFHHIRTVLVYDRPQPWEANYVSYENKSYTGNDSMGNALYAGGAIGTRCWKK